MASRSSGSVSVAAANGETLDAADSARYRISGAGCPGRRRRRTGRRSAAGAGAGRSPESRSARPHVCRADGGRPIRPGFRDVHAADENRDARRSAGCNLECPCRAGGSVPASGRRVGHAARCALRRCRHVRVRTGDARRTGHREPRESGRRVGPPPGGAGLHVRTTGLRESRRLSGVGRHRRHGPVATASVR